MRREKSVMIKHRGLPPIKGRNRKEGLKQLRAYHKPFFNELKIRLKPYAVTTYTLDIVGALSVCGSEDVIDQIPFEEILKGLDGLVAPKDGVWSK